MHALARLVYHPPPPRNPNPQTTTLTHKTTTKITHTQPVAPGPVPPPRALKGGLRRDGQPALLPPDLPPAAGAAAAEVRGGCIEPWLVWGAAIRTTPTPPHADPNHPHNTKHQRKTTAPPRPPPSPAPGCSRAGGAASSCSGNRATFPTTRTPRRSARSSSGRFTVRL